MLTRAYFASLNYYCSLGKVFKRALLLFCLRFFSPKLPPPHCEREICAGRSSGGRVAAAYSRSCDFTSEGVASCRRSVRWFSLVPGPGMCVLMPSSKAFRQKVVRLFTCSVQRDPTYFYLLLFFLGLPARLCLLSGPLCIPRLDGFLCFPAFFFLLPSCRFQRGLGFGDGALSLLRGGRRR